MELRHFRYFLMVAEELHFGRAAEKLGIAQPALSQQIKSLEQELGVALFLRTKRRVELTAAGRAFWVEARKTVEQAARAKSAGQRAARGEVGKLAVGFVGSAVYGELPFIFNLMRTRYPDVSLILHELTSEEQLQAINAHRLDVGIVRPPLADLHSMAIQVVWREPLMVALPRKHRLARQKQIALEELADESFLQVPRDLGWGFHDQITHLCARAGFVPKVVQEARATPTIVSLIAGGMGVSIVPGSLQSFERTGVVYRPLKAPVPTTDLAVIWHPGNASPALRSFLKITWEMAGIKTPPLFSV